MVKKRKATTLKNNDDKCFQYATTVSLNHENIVKDAQRVSKITSLLINTTGTKWAFHHVKRIGKNLRKNIKTILLISYTYPIIAKK